MIDTLMNIAIFCGLLTMAEQEEIDLSSCKNDKQEWKESEVRRVLKTALEARIK